MQRAKSPPAERASPRTPDTPSRRSLLRRPADIVDQTVVDWIESNVRSEEWILDVRKLMA